MLAALALSAGGLAIGPYVRSRVDREAAKRGFKVQIGTVHVGWFHLTLRDVTAELEGTNVRPRMNTVELDIGTSLALKSVSVDGVHVDLDGDLQDIAAWRARHLPTSSTKEATSVDVLVRGADVVWRNVLGDAKATVEASHASVHRGADGVSIGAETVTASREGQALTLSSAKVDLMKGMVQGAHIASARVKVELDVPGPPTDEPPAPPANGAPRSVFLHLPDTHGLRAFVQVLGQRIDAHTPPGLVATLDEVTVELVRGTEKLELGPGSVKVQRSAEQLDVEFAAGAQAATPLTLHATVPLAGGDSVVSLCRAAP